MNTRFERVKHHIQDNKRSYLAFGGGVIFAAGTMLVMRRSSISLALRETAGPALRGTGENSVFSFVSPTTIAGKTTINVSQIVDAHRQGAPSWVVRCIETGETFVSQRQAALAKGLSESRLSTHLNGITENLDGLHFERICMAA